MVGFRDEAQFSFNINDHLDEHLESVLDGKENMKSFCTLNFKPPQPIALTQSIHDMLDHGKVDEKYYEMLKEAMTNGDTIYQYRRVYVRENKSHVCPTLTANMETGGHNVPLF